MSDLLHVKEHHDAPTIVNEVASDLVQPSPLLPSARPPIEQESRLYGGKGKESAIGANSFQHVTSSYFRVPDYLRWILDNWTLSKWMPAIRCAVAEWASLILLVINPSTHAMGQVCRY